MNERQELLELTSQALITLSNAGFVKRGLKELEAGKAPSLTQQEDGTLDALFSDGTRTRLPPNCALKDAECSCPASGMCRHRVMLVLTYQHQHAEQPQAQEASEPTRWQPGDWLSELEDLPAATQRRAQALAAQGLIIDLSCSPNEVPAAHFPMSDVRFFSRNSLRFARCDCVEGTLCEHVILAVQAFAAAEAYQPGFEKITWQLQQEATQKTSAADNPFNTEEGQACIESVDALCLCLWLEGISQPPTAFDRAIKKAQRIAQQLEWRWVAAALHHLMESIQAFQNRASDYNAAQCMTECAELRARLKAAQQMAQLAQEGQRPPQPWRTIVGLGINSESQLDHLRLVSLGMKSWQDAKHYGLQLWFIDPDTGNLLHIAREWPIAEQQNSAAWQRRVANVQAATLAGGQVVAQGARRTAKGELKLETRARRTSTAPLSPLAWDMAEVERCPTTLSALKAHLCQRIPSFVRPWNHADNLFIVPINYCHQLHWNAAQQRLEAVISGSSDNDDVLYVMLPAQHSAPQAIDLLAHVLKQQDEVPLYKVSGYVTLREGRLEMEPLMIMTQQRAWALHAQPLEQPIVLPSSSPLTAQNPTLALLAQCLAQLTEWWHNGIRHQSHNMFNDMGTLATTLHEHGYEGLGRLLHQLCASITEENKKGWIDALTNVILLRDALERGDIPAEDDLPSCH